MASGAPAEPRPLQGGRLAIVAIALALGTFMQVLDSTIANVSLPTIAGTLGVSNDNSTWVITAFAVSNGAAVPLTGWLMGRFGVVKTFCLSVASFTIASFLCGIAWSLPSLIVFRVFQGAVSGPMIPGSQALLISIFPSNKRATALGIWSMTTLVAPIMGPILGGYISDNYHWSWIFLINLPIGIACTFLCWTGLAGRETPTAKLPIDYIGLGLLFFWVGLLQVMLDLGKDADWFHSTQITIFAILAAIGFVAWLIWELTEKHPIVDLSLFKYRNFLLGSISLCLGYAVFFANTLILPVWLQTQMGYTATWAGLVAAPVGVVAVVLTPITARLAGKVDARIIATISLIAFGLSYYLRSYYTTSSSFWELTMPLLVQGIGMATFFLSMISITLDGIPAARIPSASGISNFARITTASFAASIITTAWDRRETVHQSRIAEAVGSGPVFHSATTALHNLGMTDTQAAGAITRQMIGQAYLLASTDLFWLSGILCFVLIPLVWFTRRPAPPTGPIAVD